MMAWRRGKQAHGQPSFTEGMRRQRVRRDVLLVVLGALMVLPPVFVNHPIAYIPLVTYGVVLLMSWAYVRLIARGFTVEHGFAGTSCMRGTSAELPIVLKNGSRLPILCARPHVYVKNPYGGVECEVPAIAMVDAKGDDRMEVHVELGHVGAYTAGLQGVVLHDPLLLFQAYKDVEEEAVLVSTPRDHYVDVVKFSDMAVHESHAPVRTVLSDNVDYAGTRDYEFGDPMKSVHWKLSARAGDLQTRIFEASVNTKLSVVMDFHAPAYTAEQLLSCFDVIVEMALAVMRLAQRRNVEVKLCYIDKGGSNVARALPKTDEQEAFVSSLPLLSPEVSGEDALGIAEREVQRFGGSDSIVFCTSALSQELVARVAEMRAGHRSITVILAVPRDVLSTFHRENQGILNEFSNAGVPCIIVSDASDLGQVSVDG